MSLSVSRIDHAVYWVSNLARMRDFYMNVLGLTDVVTQAGVCLLRAQGSAQHHDLGLFEIGAAALRAPHRSVGLYHIAWKVLAIEDLVEAMKALQSANAFTGASDHGATKSVYGKDPDGNEIEITFTIPRADWGDWENSGTVAPLDMEREIARYGRQANSGQA